MRLRVLLQMLGESFYGSGGMFWVSPKGEVIQAFDDHGDTACEEILPDPWNDMRMIEAMISNGERHTPEEAAEYKQFRERVAAEYGVPFPEGGIKDASIIVSCLMGWVRCEYETSNQLDLEGANLRAIHQAAELLYHENVTMLNIQGMTSMIKNPAAKFRGNYRLEGPAVSVFLKSGRIPRISPNLDPGEAI
jgi:hypothetical protein